MYIVASSLIASQSHYEFGEEFVNSVPIKVAHKSLLETSKALFNSDVASAADFYRNHKIAYMLKGETKPTVIDTITLEDKNATKCLAISNNM